MEQAIAEALIALRLRSNYPNPFISIGEAYFHKGLFDNSLVFYQRALRVRPDYPDAYLGIGNAYARKYDMDLAIEAYKKVIELSPDNITALVNLAAAYGSKGLTEKATTLLRYALRIKPDSPDIHYNLGFAYEELAKSHGNNVHEDLMNEAVKHYKEAVRINPDDIEARERLLNLMSQ
jgi:tetratricopeptide (TPR) repeat protein